MTANATITQNQFTYGKMFKNLEPFDPPREALTALGINMHTPKDQERSKLPAGYVFLGQFIDHDLSRDEKGRSFPGEPMEPSSLINERFPFFNLDTLYGEGPLKDKHLYKCEHSIKLRLSETTPGVFVTKKFRNDLPRNKQFSATAVDPKDIQTALTMDDRQDENLAISQTHVAFIKFHNAVIDRKFGGDDSLKNFEAVKKIVIRHYQWIVLKDFLPRLVQRDILEDVINNGQKYYRPDQDGPFMPVEFSVAAFRMGHSIVPQSFNWNSQFTSATVKDLSDFTARGRMQGATEWDDATGTRLPIQSLPSRWVIDWTRFYDFKGIDNSFKLLNFSARIDTSIIDRFKTLIPDVGGVITERSSLAVRNLFRGRMLKLPSGQAVAGELKLPPLSFTEITEKMDDNCKAAFGANTPLWYYILREAELTPDNDDGADRLGPVGSRIMAETMVGLMRISPFSILNETAWRPTLYAPGKEREKYEMADLLFYIGDLNPLA